MKIKVDGLPIIEVTNITDYPIDGVVEVMMIRIVGTYTTNENKFQIIDGVQKLAPTNVIKPIDTIINKMHVRELIP